MSPTPDDLTAYEDKPEHRHWNTYDMSLEGCLFNRLHEVVSAPKLDFAEASSIGVKLEDLARGKGYGDEDSYLCDTGSMTEAEIADSPYHMAMRGSYAEDPDSQYTAELDKSQRILLSVCATDSSKVFVNVLRGALDHARTTGQEMRRKLEENGEAVPNGPGF